MKSIIKALKERPVITTYRLAIYPALIIMLLLTSCLVAAFNLSAKDGVDFFNEAL
jgi:lipid A disaccharide synthetase